jgi:excisionase family DNA binding protein
MEVATMTAALKRDQQTYLPSDGGKQLAEVHDFLAAHEAAGRDTIEPRYLLVGADQGDQVEIPQEIHRILLQVVDAMSSGLAVTVAPQSMTMTTQQAADLLGISRPTLVKILNDGGMPYEQIKTHRRVLLADVLAYREQRRNAQYAALAATSIDLNDEDDLATVLDQLRQAKRVAGNRRRAGAANT